MLTGALAVATTALTGCGVRLEDDAPDLPFVPRREPIPAEQALLAVLGALEAGGEEHATQRADLLREALVEAQVPESVIADASAPASDAETAAAFEAAVRECGAGMLGLVGRLTATHRITSPLGDKPRLWTTPPAEAWTAGKIAADALEATRATMYALDLIAARSSTTVSKAVLDTGTELEGLAVRQTTAAGKHVGSATLGYERPDDLRGSKAMEWGTESFGKLLVAYGACFDGLADDRDAALETVTWMVTAERLSRPRFAQPVPVLYGDTTATG
ncbi:hypothetical protein ASJ30_05425 [Janibacter indicus]|nr:hypothetical protein ASJ30_05425 [Janibacter indicus]